MRMINNYEDLRKNLVTTLVLNLVSMKPQNSEGFIFISIFVESREL